MSDVESKTDTDVVLEDAQLDDEQREAKALELKLEGNKKFTSKDYNAAIDFYSQAISMYDQRAEFYGNRAAAYILIENYSKSLKDCLSALQIDDTYKKAYIRGIKCYSEMGEFTQAKKFAQTGLIHYPSDYELRKSLSQIEIILQKLYKIEEKLTKVSLKYNALYEQQLSSTMIFNKNTNDSEMKTDTNTNNPSTNHPIIHKISDKDLREVEIALSIINSLLKSGELSTNIDLKCTKIRALIIKQDNISALSMATALLRYRPNYIPIMKLRAIALFRNNNVPSAVKHMQTVLRADPDNDHCSKLFKLFRSIPRLKEAANIAVKNGELEEAIAKYSECLASDPINHTLNSIIYANRATIWLKKSDFQSAYDDCCMSLQLQPGYLKAICRRFTALMGLKRFDEAVGDAERALKLHPYDQKFRAMLKTAKVELKKSKRKNYYQILGVASNASEYEIKKGFRKQAMLWHPDKFAAGTEEEMKKAEEKFKEIGEAYEVLKDEKMKAQYDNGADLEEIKQGAHSHFPGGHVDISQIFDLLGGGGGGFGGGFPGMSSGGRGRGGQTFTFRFG